MTHDNSANKLDEKKQLRAVSSSNIEGPLVLLDFGDVSFLISNIDIVTLMSAQKIAGSILPQACGEVVVDGCSVPVFAINKALQLIPVRPLNHLTLVVLRYQTRIFALCCATLEKIETSDLQFFPVPINMTSRKQPFAQFAVINNRAAGLTSALNLSRLLETRGAVFPSQSLKPFLQNNIQEAG